MFNSKAMCCLTPNYMKAKNLIVTALALALFAICRPAQAQGTAFTYQGNLTSGGAAANGNFDLRFGLYTNVSIGNFIGSLETNSAVAVSNGLFTTTLNFSNVFNGSNYWLEIGVRSNGTTNAFTILSPRQPITPTPYAITASNLTGTLPAGQLTGTVPASAISGTFSNSVSFTNLTNVFAGNGGGLTNVPSVTQSNFLYLFDTTTQTLTTAGTFQSVTFTTSGTSLGWVASTSSAFNPQQTGVYLVQYQAHIQNNNTTSAITVAGRCLVGGLEVTGSESILSVPAAFSLGILSRSFLVQIQAGQSLTFQVVNNASGTTTLLTGTFEGQSFPSASLTAVRIQ
jgi:hypothetical protein